MNREIHVRICESLRGQFPRATRPSLQANCFSSSGCVRSGLSQTSSFNFQLRVDRDQRCGLRCLASA